MYVCVCQGVTDRDIRNAVAEGACSMRALKQRLGVCSDCGKCGVCAKDLLREALEHRDRMNQHGANVLIPVISAG